MNKNNYSDYNTKSNEEEYVVSAEKAIEWIYLGDIFVAVWNKIYSMKFLKNNILFDEKIWYGEGMLFNIDCLQFVDSIAVGEKSVYHQVSNPNSAMRKFNVDSNLCGIRSLEIQKKHWRKSNPAIVDAWNYRVTVKGDRHQCGQPSVNLRQVPGQSNGQWCEIGKRGK